MSTVKERWWQIDGVSMSTDVNGKIDPEHITLKLSTFKGTIIAQADFRKAHPMVDGQTRVPMPADLQGGPLLLNTYQSIQQAYNNAKMNPDWESEHCKKCVTSNQCKIPLAKFSLESVRHKGGGPLEVLV